MKWDLEETGEKREKYIWSGLTDSKKLAESSWEKRWKEREKGDSDSAACASETMTISLMIFGSWGLQSELK